MGATSIGGRGRQTFATIQLVLDRNEEAVDLSSALDEQQGFGATHCPDHVKLDACVRSIHRGEPDMRREKRPAGEHARNRVCEARSPERVAHEVAHLLEGHGDDDLRNVPGGDFLF